METQDSKPNIAPTRVGVVLADLGKLNVIALKYLITHLNTLQHCFEFEILDANTEGDPLAPLMKPLT